MRLVGYFGMLRKSQEVGARNVDPKGINASHKPNPGTLCPPNPPRVIGLNINTDKINDKIICQKIAKNV